MPKRIPEEELIAAQKRARIAFCAALAECYARALRAGRTPEEICKSVGKSIHWAIQCLTDPSSLTIDEVATFAFACGCEIKISTRAREEVIERDCA